MKMYFFLAAAAISLTATSAHAWGPNGHRVTGKIAQDNLKPEAQAEVTGLLGESFDLTQFHAVQSD